MSRSRAAVLLGALAVSLAPLPAEADPISFKVLYTSRAAFKTDAPLETIVGTTSGEAVTGSLIVDPARPQGAIGSVRVDLTTLKTGIEKRDADMRAKTYLDTEVEANKYAVFEVKGVEASGALEPGRETPAKVRAAVKGLTEQQLDTPYRAGGWTVRQLVHHLADRHMNAHVRFQLALPEK